MKTESNPDLLGSAASRFSMPASFEAQELEESPKILSRKEILVKSLPTPWIITKTIKTVQIKTLDIEVVRSALEELSIITPENNQLEKEFIERADRWERESSIHSSPGEKFLHKDYLRIIGKGEPVVPFIIKRLKSSKKDWLFALENIVPEDQNPAKGIENFKDAVKAWIAWGENKFSQLE